MANYNRFRITSIGRAALSQLLQGEGKCRFTKVCSTDRKYEESGIAALTELADIKQTVTPTSVIAVDSTTVRVTANFTDSDTGYYINTIGLYISVGASDVLYAVCAADTAIYMPARSDLSGENQAVFECYITVGDTDAVEIAVVPANTASEAEVVAVRGQIADLTAYIGYTAPDIYGVEVDYENNKITRLAGAVGLTPGAEFDSIAPWHRRRCNMTHDGTVTAYLGDEGYTETGFTTTEITPEDSMTTYPIGTPVNVMVEQPPFYYKVVPLRVESTSSGFIARKMRYYISAVPKDGFTLHPVFSDNYTPVYLAAYESCLYDTDASTYESIMFDPDAAIDVTKHRLASVSGGNVILSERTFSGYEDAAGIGSSAYFGQMVYGKYSVQTQKALEATQLLFLIEYASFDAQANIGIGIIDEPLNGTGSTASLGNTSNSVSDGSVSYRGEENLWGHYWYTTMQTFELTEACANGYISAFYFKKYQDADSNMNLLQSTEKLSSGFKINRASDTALFDVAETLGTSSRPIGDLCKRDAVVTGLLTDRYVLHGGKNSEDDTTQSGLFALYYTPNNEGTDTLFTVRIFFSSRNRGNDLANEMLQ